MVSAGACTRNHSMKADAAIATPAPVGTGTLCMPRSLGGSSRCDETMARTYQPVSSQASNAALAARRTVCTVAPPRPSSGLP